MNQISNENEALNAAICLGAIFLALRHVYRMYEMKKNAERFNTLNINILDYNQFIVNSHRPAIFLETISLLTMGLCYAAKHYFESNIPVIMYLEFERRENKAMGTYYTSAMYLESKLSVIHSF